MPDYRSNADKRKAVIEKFQTLIEEFGSIEQIPKKWSDRQIAKHCGVSNRMVSDIHLELKGARKISQIQRVKSALVACKAQLEAERDKNRQLELEVQRLHAELASKVRSPPSESQPQEEPATPENKYRAILTGSGQIWLVFPYDPTVIALIKRVSGGTWEPGEKRGRRPKGWYYPISSGEQLMEVLNQQEFDIDPKIHEAIAQHKAELERKEIERIEALFRRERELEQRTAALVEEACLDEPLPNGWTLYQHQKEGVRWLLHRRVGNLYRGGILADQMGLGKSLQALVAAKALQQATGCHVFVVSPGILLDKPWLEEAEIVGVEIEVFSDYHSSIPRPLENAKYLVIVDEAHRYQSLTSLRTKALVRLAKHQNCIATWLLTGTPMANGKPANLFPLLEICEHPLASDKWEYESHYCQGQQVSVGKGRTAWRAEGAAYLDELAQKIDDVQLRRTKRQCLDLPPKIRTLQPIELSEKSQKVYDKMLKELQQSDRDRLKAGLISEEGAALARITQLRKAASLAKVEATVSLALEVLQDGDQIVMFTEFKDTAGRIYEALIELGFSAELLTGETPKEERQPMIDRFQNGKTKAIVGTSATGGLGITLTSASVLVLVDRSWVPGVNEQTEDRLHRIGQEQAVTCIWLQYGFIDLVIDRLLDRKTQCIEYVLGGERRTLQSALDKPSELARELLEAMFGLEPNQHPDDEN